MKDTELAYLAGIIDGEGYIGQSTWAKADGSRSFTTDQIRITNNNFQLISWIKDTVGFGHIYKRKPHKGWNQTWDFVVYGANARLLLLLISPYLLVKMPYAVIRKGGT